MKNMQKAATKNTLSRLEKKYNASQHRAKMREAAWVTKQYRHVSMVVRTG